MKKIRIIIDSFSGRTQKQANALGFDFIPLQVILDDNKINDGVDMSFSDLMDKIEKEKNVFTSQPNPSEMENTFKQALKKAEKVIYLCVGSKMSSTYSTANAIANNFDGKVEIWDNSFSGPSFEFAAKWLDHAVNEQNMSLSDAKKTITKFSSNIVTWIIPANANSIRKGGRAKAGAKFLLSKMNMIPIIKYSNSQIDIKGVRRGFGKAVSKVIERMLEEIGENNIENYNFTIMYTNQGEELQITESKLSNANISFNKEVTSSAIAIQVGIGAVSITALPKKI